MLNLLKGSLNYFIIVLVFPFLLLFMTYYGFESSYVNIKHLEQPPDFIFSSVYAYRIIPNYISVEMNAFLTSFVNEHLSSIKHVIIKHGTIYYHSVFLTNALFFLLSFVVLERIINFLGTIIFSSSKNLLLFLSAVFMVCISQYVPTNGDSVALLFFLLGVLFSLKYAKDNNVFNFLVVSVVIVISTLVRETSSLNIAFFAALLVDFKKLNALKTKTILQISILVLSFLVPYVLLRTIVIKQETAFFEGVYFIQNFTSPFNILGLLFGLIGIFIFKSLIKNPEREVVFNRYLLFSTPYFLMIIFVGLFWEIRLFLPIIMVATLLSTETVTKKYL